MRLSEEDQKRVADDWDGFSKSRGWAYAKEELEFALLRMAESLRNPKLSSREIDLACGEIAAMKKFLDMPTTIVNAIHLNMKLAEGKKQ